MYSTIIGGGGNPLNYGGYKKIGDRGFNWGGGRGCLRGFKGAKLTKISCVRF